MSIADHENYTEAEAEAFLRLENQRYRAGDPVLTDAEYDALMAFYAEQYPDNAWFNQEDVEPDELGGKTVTLPQRMLSTNKAYSIKEIEKWANDVIAIGKELGIYDVFFRITAKLDGFAAYLDGQNLYTRGNGRSGTDISRALSRGLQVNNLTKNAGPGEIVVNKRFFTRELADKYENSRNIIAAVIKEGELDDAIKGAIGAGAVVFHVFRDLNGWTRTKDEMLIELEDIWGANAKTCEYDTDGLVIEVTNERIKAAMGSTNHHHRWQIAFKKNEEFHDIKVTGIVWQTSKTGRITPVVQLEPTKVSGVTISKATGHSWGYLFKRGIYKGAIVKVCRSGLVIPHIAEVITPALATEVYTPAHCPSCGANTDVDGDNLLCSNAETCPAQKERTLEFFFKTLGTCDGFGPKIIEKLVALHNDISVYDIYTGRGDPYGINKLFGRAGISQGVGNNLIAELQASRWRPVEDWRFLAAFSINNVGKGGCEKLLKHHRLADVFTLTPNDIMAIDGFAQKTAYSLVKSLERIKPQFDALMELGFNLIRTPLVSEKVTSSPISGKTVVFTGTMQKGSRDAMEANAKLLGATVAGSVSSKTDYLICGAKVGAAKTTAATKHNVTILSEDAYLQLINTAG